MVDIVKDKKKTGTLDFVRNPPPVDLIHQNVFLGSLELLLGTLAMTALLNHYKTSMRPKFLT